MANALQTYSAGLIIRQKEPTNLESPLDQVDSYLTPTGLFVSSESLAVPEGQPWMERRVMMICSGLIESGSEAVREDRRGGQSGDLRVQPAVRRDQRCRPPGGWWSGSSVLLMMTATRNHALYQHDRTTSPELERFLANRMHAKTIEVDASHLSLITHPGDYGPHRERRRPSRLTGSNQI
jgi:hypothetical protein